MDNIQEFCYCVNAFISKLTHLFILQHSCDFQQPTGNVCHTVTIILKAWESCMSCNGERENYIYYERDERLKRIRRTLSNPTGATLKVAETFLQPVLLDKPTNSQFG